MLKDRHNTPLTLGQVLKKIAFRFYKTIVELEVFVLRLAGYIPSHTIRNLIYMMAGIKMGKGSTLHMGARFYHPCNIEIGNDTIIGEDVVLDGRAKLKIGSHVDFASEVMVYNAHHDLKDPHFAPIIKPVVIEDYVFVGPRAIILPGVTIKKGAVVAAGAVVTKDVDEGTIVGGVPAKAISKRELKKYNYILGRADWFR